MPQIAGDRLRGAIVSVLSQLYVEIVNSPLKSRVAADADRVATAIEALGSMPNAERMRRVRARRRDAGGRGA